MQIAATQPRRGTILALALLAACAYAAFAHGAVRIPDESWLQIGLDVVALPWPAALVAAGSGDPKARGVTVVASDHVRPSWWHEVYARAGAASLAVARLEVAHQEHSPTEPPVTP